MNKRYPRLIQTVLLVITAIVVLFTWDFVKAHLRARISREVLENSQRAMEIMLNEIKYAQGVYLPASVLNSHPGHLSLRTRQNSFSDETATYIDFYLDQDGRLCMKKEGEETKKITSGDVKINSLVFQYLAANGSKSVRVYLLASYDKDNRMNFWATTTLVSTATLRL